VTIGETKLKMAGRHVAEQEERIIRQEALIQRRREGGAKVDSSLALLAEMKDLLERMRAHMARISS
jgi:hypothetical protein